MSTQKSDIEKIQELYESFETGDPTVGGLYIRPDYIQHNLSIGTGLAGFGELMQHKPPQGFKAKIVRIFQDGDFVVTHSEYDFFGPKIGLDVWRFQSGQIAEHWDNLDAIHPKNPSGRTQTDGETKVIDLDKTQANKTLVANFANDILVGGKMDKITDYLSPDYHQHNANIGDGISGLMAAFKYFQEEGLQLQVTKIHRVLAQGNFVLVMSEGKPGKDQDAAFYDLFRLHDEKIVEHWDVIESILPKEQWKNANGKF